MSAQILSKSRPTTSKREIWSIVSNQPVQIACLNKRLLQMMKAKIAQKAKKISGKNGKLKEEWAS